MNCSWKIKYWKYNDLTLFVGSVRTFHFLSSVVNGNGKCLGLFYTTMTRRLFLQLSFVVQLKPTENYEQGKSDTIEEGETRAARGKK